MKIILKTILSLCFLLSPLGSAFAGSFNAQDFNQRRAEIIKAIGDNAMVVLFPNEEKTRSNDTEYAFRQNTHLYYLTGNIMQDSHLVILSNKGDKREYLFVKQGDPQFETWIGRLPTKEENIATSGIETIVDVKRFPNTVNGILNGRGATKDQDFLSQFKAAVDNGAATLWLDLGANRSFDGDEPMTKEQVFAAQVRQNFPEIKIRNLTPLLRSMREVKTVNELKALQVAIDATIAGHKAAMDAARTAATEAQVRAALESAFISNGGDGFGFPSIVARGDNATILHYTKNNAPIEKDKLILVDIGAESEYYSADVTRTFPIDGTYSDVQKDIYQIVLDAQFAAFALTKPGVEYTVLSDKANEVVGAGLLKLGLISENTFEQMRLYYFHGLGHSIGLDVHDPYDRYKNPLKVGFVFTIEPGIYVRAKDVVKNPVFLGLSAEAQAGIRAALEKYDGIGVRIEDDVLVTQKGAQWLSDGAPRTIADIEAYMAK